MAFIAMALAVRTPFPLWEVLLALLAVVGLSAAGCAGPSRTRRLKSSVFHAARLEAHGPYRPRAGGDEGAALVERALHDAGLRFGTDGSTRALWGYLRASHQLVAPAQARRGDILFFDMDGPEPAARCDHDADHAGIVESVTPAGRITFVEARGGRVRHSVVDPARPTARRDARGDVVNSFLRAKAITDPPDARYFAGEMLCGVARVTHR